MSWQKSKSWWIWEWGLESRSGGSCMTLWRLWNNRSLWNTQKWICQCCRDCWVLNCSEVSGSRGPMDCRPPSSSIHGILQTVTLECVAISYSRGSSQPRDRNHISCISCIADRFFTTESSGQRVLSAFSFIGSPRINLERIYKASPLCFSNVTRQRNLKR